MSVKYYKIDDNAQGQRLDNYLIKHLKGVPKSHIYRLIRKGSVRINKGRQRVHYKLKSGDTLRVPPVYNSTSSTISISKSLTQILKDSVLYEDDGLIALNKLPGLASHGGSGINLGVIEAMRQVYGKTLELVHRLDKDASGCLLIAKKRLVLKSLQAQLRARKVEKYYLALLKNAWQKKKHTIDAPILKKTSKHAHHSKVSTQGKVALSYFHPIKNIHHSNWSLSLVRIHIKTGRTHQIRLHAAYAGHPLVGDDKYGDDDFNQIMHTHQIKHLCLHAEQINFINPKNNAYQKISAPLSANFKRVIDSL